MKCDKYKVLIDRLIDGDVASNEKAELIDHIEQCELCRQEYQAVLSYLAATSGLSKVKPVFCKQKRVHRPCI
jgi:predicted anti-sigma-YlaC factor YlaD